MKLRLLLSALLLAWSGMWAQTVVLDFETPATSTSFEYFGNQGLNGTSPAVIANPDKSGINTSDSVAAFVRVVNAEFFAGCSSNPNPATALDFINNDEICVKIWAPAAGQFKFKLEEGPGNRTWERDYNVQANEVNQWLEICFSADSPSSVGGPPIAGEVFNKVVVFFDFNTTMNTSGVDDTYYFDDIVLKSSGGSSAACNPVLDFEMPATSTTYSYFGNQGLNGTAPAIIANPDKSGINLSDSVTEFVRVVNAEFFAGCNTSPNPVAPFDFVTNEEICVKIWCPAAGRFLFKLEEGPGGRTWERDYIVQAGEVNQWLEICFDADSADLAGAGPAAGQVFNKSVVFFDFGTTTNASGVDDTYYFDDICLKGGSVVDSIDVTFSVDMSNVADPFTQVYVSGTWDNFSGTSNPLSDQGNGVWSGTVRMMPGAFEYKFQADDYAVEESFLPTDECVKVTGQFINREAFSASDTTLATPCFSSCYACDQEVMITANLRFAAGSMVDSANVYMAGGATFGAAANGTRFEWMQADSLFLLTFRRQKGFNDFFTITNGPCGDYSCKEDISNQYCARPDNFNDRFMGPIMADTTMYMCFENCDSTACGFNIIASIRQPQTGWFKVVPSQTDRFATVDFGQVNGVKDIMILNSAGQIVQRYNTMDREMRVDMVELTSGLYFVRVQAGTQIGVEKLVKY